MKCIFGSRSASTIDRPPATTIPTIDTPKLPELKRQLSDKGKRCLAAALDPEALVTVATPSPPKKRRWIFKVTLFKLDGTVLELCMEHDANVRALRQKITGLTGVQPGCQVFHSIESETPLSDNKTLLADLCQEMEWEDFDGDGTHLGEQYDCCKSLEFVLYFKGVTSAKEKRAEKTKMMMQERALRANSGETSGSTVAAGKDGRTGVQMCEIYSTGLDRTCTRIARMKCITCTTFLCATCSTLHTAHSWTHTIETFKPLQQEKPLSDYSACFTNR